MTPDPLLAGVMAAVERLIAARRADDRSTDDPFRGLYLSDEHIDSMLLARPADIGSETPPPELGRLADLVSWLGLTAFDAWALVVAMAPDLDLRFERFFGYLNDDVSRRRATTNLVIELAGRRATDPNARARLQPGAPLIDRGLVVVDDVERPFLSRSLRVPDRVTQHLLGDDMIGAELRRWVSVAAWLDTDTPGGRWLADHPQLVYGPLKSCPRVVQAFAPDSDGQAALLADVALMAADQPEDTQVRSLVTEAALARAVLIVTNTDRLSSAAMQVLAVAAPAVMVGRRSWNPDWSLELPLSIAEMSMLSTSSETVRQTAQPLPTLTDRALQHTIRSRPDHASGLGPAPQSVRMLNGVGLERLARRVSPSAGWSDLIVSRTLRGDLAHLVDRVRLREIVLDDWHMRRGGGRGESITALFTGESGTGKTLAAEIVAGVIGQDLYVIDLSAVVDKYIGETEKNLERIFSDAEDLDGVLFFDEADALFGKRSEVRDAKDRYANVEVAFLLERMERFDGLAILATNLRANLDDAFTRRLSMMLEFTKPDEGLRLQLWQAMLSKVPKADDLDLEFCARAFDFTGGGIRSAAVAAAYHAAAGSQQITMAAIMRGIHLELRKQGRLVVNGQFGPYEAALATSAALT